MTWSSQLRCLIWTWKQGLSVFRRAASVMSILMRWHSRGLWEWLWKSQETTSHNTTLTMPSTNSTSTTMPVWSSCKASGTANPRSTQIHPSSSSQTRSSTRTAPIHLCRPCLPSIPRASWIAMTTTWRSRAPLNSMTRKLRMRRAWRAAWCSSMIFIKGDRISKGVLAPKMETPMAGRIERKAQGRCKRSLFRANSTLTQYWLPSRASRRHTGHSAPRLPKC